MNNIILVIGILLSSCSDFFLSELDECGVPGGDNSSCLDECGIPNGNGILEGQCDCNNNIVGCDGICGSGYVFDICGVCNGTETETINCNCENSNELLDCLGVCGGTAIIDDCGVCNGYNISCTGCMIPGSDNYSSSYIIENNESCYVSYDSTIQPIFNNNCVMCHGSSGGLDLSSYEDLLFGGDIGPVISLGDSINSILWQVISPPSITMPKGMESLSNKQINQIALWLQFGAEE